MMKLIILGLSIFLIFSVGLNVLYFSRSTKNKVKPEFLGSILMKNELGADNSLQVVDINGDHIDEVIYTANSFSWWNEIKILDDDLKSFCEHCSFITNNGSADFQDLNSDGALELILTNGYISVDSTQSGQVKALSVFRFTDDDFVEKSE